MIFIDMKRSSTKRRIWCILMGLDKNLVGNLVYKIKCYNPYLKILYFIPKTYEMTILP